MFGQYERCTVAVCFISFAYLLEVHIYARKRQCWKFCSMEWCSNVKPSTSFGSALLPQGRWIIMIYFLITAGELCFDYTLLCNVIRVCRFDLLCARLCLLCNYNQIGFLRSRNRREREKTVKSAIFFSSSSYLGPPRRATGPSRDTERRMDTDVHSHFLTVSFSPMFFFFTHNDILFTLLSIM